jgi:hypothetical protein
MTWNVNSFVCGSAADVGCTRTQGLSVGFVPKNNEEQFQVSSGAASRYGFVMCKVALCSKLVLICIIIRL